MIHAFLCMQTSACNSKSPCLHDLWMSACLTSLQESLQSTSMLTLPIGLQFELHEYLGFCESSGKALLVQSCVSHFQHAKSSICNGPPSSPQADTIKNLVCFAIPLNYFAAFSLKIYCEVQTQFSFSYPYAQRAQRIF